MWLPVAFICGLAALVPVNAQNATTPSISLTPTTIFTFTQIPTTITLVLPPTATQSQGRPASITSIITTTITSSYPISTFTPTPSISNQTESHEAESLHLNTTVDPAFAVLGAILILTGLPSAFWGHKNRWTSFFLIGFYTLALVCISLILEFGVLKAVNPPSKVLRGLFLLSCVVSGVVGGGLTIFFWRQTKFFIGAWGGLAFGLWIQCFHTGGLIKPIGYRWFLFTACAVVGFCLCTIQKIHYHVLLVSTAMVGATAFMLGVDCYTTAGLKEFYVYNLGFRALFPKFSYIDFPVSQTMMIEIGLIAAVTIIGGAVQLRILAVLRNRLKEINEEQRLRDLDVEQRAAQRFEVVERDRDRWEKEHGNQKPPGGHDRTSSAVASTLADGKDSASHLMEKFSGDGTKRQSTDLLEGVQPGLDGNMIGLQTNEIRPTQSSGPLPTLDLGSGIQQQLGTLGSQEIGGTPTVDNDPELQEKLKLLREIQDVRRSIIALKSVTPELHRVSQLIPSQSAEIVATSVGATPLEGHAGDRSRPPRETNPAAVDSRPRSLDWDAYVRERRLFTPPAGVTPPIPASVIPTPIGADAPYGPNGPPLPIPDSVSEALARRTAAEKMWENGINPTALQPRSRYSSARSQQLIDGTKHLRDMDPAALGEQSTSRVRVDSYRTTDLKSGRRPQGHSRSRSAGSANILVLPPRNNTSGVPNAQSSGPQYKTYEELTERHRSAIHALQDPISKAEAEQKKLDEARSRWERSKDIERQVMSKRERDQEAEYDAARKQNAQRSRKRGGRSPDPETGGDHNDRARTRSLGRELEDNAGGRRTSTIVKVQEWQKYQQRNSAGSVRPRGDSAGHQGAAPFPQPVMAPGNPSGARRSAQLERPSATRPISEHMDKWNLYSSPGSSRPPPN